MLWLNKLIQSMALNMPKSLPYNDEHERYSPWHLHHQCVEIDARMVLTTLRKYVAKVLDILLMKFCKQHEMKTEEQVHWKSIIHLILHIFIQCFPCISGHLISSYCSMKVLQNPENLNTKTGALYLFLLGVSEGCRPFTTRYQRNHNFPIVNNISIIRNVF